MLGDLPPNSSETRFNPLAACAMIREPTAVEPVNEILRMSGWLTSASPISPPGPGSTCRTPAGSPAACANSPSFKAVNGDRLAGFKMTQFPVANAGATFHDAIGSGKFHGTIAATTPIDWRKVKSNPPRATGIVWP